MAGCRRRIETVVVRVRQRHDEQPTTEGVARETKHRAAHFHLGRRNPLGAPVGDADRCDFLAARAERQRSGDVPAVVGGDKCQPTSPLTGRQLQMREQAAIYATHVEGPEAYRLYVIDY